MIAKKTEASAAGRGGLLPCVLDAVYLAALALAVPYLVLIGKGAKVRDHFRRRCRPIAMRQGTRPCLWVHGVSAGEMFSAQALIEEFAREYSDWEIVLSTSARAGIEAARRQYPNTFLFSYPFDLSAIVRRAFDRIRPDLIVIVEHELWPNFLGEARRRDVPVAVVNGRLSRRSLRGYRWLSRLVDWPPRSIAKFCVEDELSAARFRELGVSSERVRVTGNLKFDRSVTLSRDLAERRRLLGEGWTLVAASTHPGEEELVLRAFGEMHRADPLCRLVLAPRRVERARDVTRIIQKHGLRCRRWSDVLHAHAGGLESNGNGNGNGHRHVDPMGVDSCEVLVVDSVGDLPELMAVGDAVFVGGSLVPFGGHNVIEPAVVGKPVVIGPHHESFRRVVASFLEKDAVLVARDERELLEHLHALKLRPQIGRGMVRRASETIATHAGASLRTLEALRPLIEDCDVLSSPLRATSAVSDQRSTVSSQPSAVGGRRSAFSSQPES